MKRIIATFAMVMTLAIPASAASMGGTGNDVIRGTNGADVLRAGAGNDVIYARGGADDVFGGPGNDIAFVDRLDNVVGVEVVVYV